MRIESRMLFDGAIGVTADALVPEPEQIEPNPVEATVHTLKPTDDPISGELPNLDNAQVELASPDIVVFIDERLSDREQLLAGVSADTHVVVINANRSGVDQMAQALDGLAGVQSVHIISTGEPGRLNLGGSVLTLESIRGEYSEQLAQLGGSLSDTADILIYGCNFGADTEAGSAAQAFADATGADVASSTDLTGHASRGGDWVLERQTGTIETIAMDPTNWTGLLDPVVISTTNTPVINNPAGTNLATPYNINGITQGGSLIQPGGGTTIVGTTALWTSAGSVGGQTIDLRATVLNAGANDMIQFSSAQTPGATTDDPIVVVGEFGGNGNGPAQDVQVQVRWEVLETGTNNQLSGDLAILFTDIDGVAGPGTREAIAASIFDPVSYTLENPTDLVGSVQGNLLQVDGTVPNTGGNESQNNRVWTRFNWINESEFEITYILYANNNVTFLAGFSHDGDGDLVFTNPVTAAIPKLDLDQSAAGNNYTTTFTEDGSAVAIADTDVTITNSGGTIDGAVITLTNRMAGDTLSVAALPAGLTATTDTTDPTAIVVTITGTGTDAQYQTALQAVSFANTSQAPDSTQRIIDVQVENTLTPGNTAQALITVVPLNDAPVNSVPGAQALTEDVNHSFGTATANPITVSDVDAAGANLTTTLSVPAGSLDLGSTAGVTVTGDGTDTVSVTGSVSAINAALDGLTYTPVPHDNGAITLTVLTTDNGNTGAPGALEDTDAITLNIAAVNDAPYANDDNYSTNEDIAVTFDVRSNDGDVDGPPLNVTQINGTAISVGSPVTLTEGVLSMGAGGLLTFTPNENFSGTVNFSYQISDTGGLTATANATITVAAVNDAPVAINDSDSAAEDNDVSIDVLGNDSDAEGDTLTITQIDGSPAIVNIPVAVTDGTVTLQPSGELLFSPTPHFNGNASFDYQIDDGNGGIATATVTVDITPVNDLPVAGNDTYSTAEDTPITFDVRSNDGDVDGQPLFVSHINGTPFSIGAPAVLPEGTITVNAAGILTFTPNLNFNGPVNFNYTINDGNGGTDTATVQITVTAVDDAPVATNDNATTDEDTNVVIDALDNDSDPEGATLSITQIDGTNVAVGTPVAVTDGQVTLQADGTLLFEPAQNFNGNAVFTYTISDGTGNSDIGTVTVDVQPINDGPTANPDSVNTQEDTPVTLDVLANDSDIEAGTLSVVSIDGTTAVIGTPIIVTDGSVTLQGDGTLLFVPTPHFNGTATFNYTIEDAGGASATTTATVIVSAVNDAPYAGNDTQSTPEDTPISFDVRTNDGDVDGDPLTVSEIDGTAISVGNPVSVANGEVSINAAGVLTFTPSNNFNGDASFTYQISDGNGEVANASVTVTVTPVNDAPVASNDATTTAEETAVNLDLVANDTDVDSATLSVTQVNGSAISVGSPVNVANGTVSLLPDGTIDFEPATDFTGVANFTYQVSDGNGGSDLAMVQVTVTNVNDAPIATNDSASTNEDTAVAIDVVNNDSDIESDSLQVSEVNGQTISLGNPIIVTNGTVALQPDGQLLFTPSQDFNGLTNFTYTVSDGNGGTDTATVEVSVAAQNDAPVAVDNSGSTNEDTNITIDVVANDTDVDGDSLAVTTINGTPALVNQGVAVANGTVTLRVDGSLTFEPAPEFNGQTSYEYVVSDGTTESNSATVTIDVDPVNDLPVASNDSDTTAEDTAITLDVLSNDTDLDGDSLSVSEIDGQTISVGNPVSITNGLVALQADGQLVFTPNSDYNGPITFNYTVTDGNGGTDTASVGITVTPVNDAPVATNDNDSTNEDVAISLNVIANDSDVDGDSLAVTEINGQPASIGSPIAITNGTVELQPNGELLFTPSPNYTGNASFNYTVADNTGASDTANVTLTVNAVNDAPVATNDSDTLTEDTPITLDVIANDSDLDGDALAVTHVNGTAITLTSAVSVLNGTVSLNPDGTVLFTPTPHFNGTTDFTYTVSDPGGLSDDATVALTVTAVNDAPYAGNDTTSTPEDTPVSIDVRSNDGDVDNDPLSVSQINGTPISVGNPVAIANGAVSIDASGILTFSPAPNYAGPASFNYTIGDGNGLTASANVDITVTSVNDAPIAISDSASTPEDTAINMNLLTNDSDIDGDALNISEINGTAISTGETVTISNGSVTLRVDGTVDVTPNTNYTGNLTFDYRVSDGAGGSDTASVDVTVTPVNDPPVAVDDSISTNEDTTVNLDLIANDTDVDSASLSVTQINGQPVSAGSAVSVPNGLVTVLIDGTVDVTPDADYVGPIAFDYTVSDGSTGSDTGAVIVTVTPANDAPIAADNNTSTPEDTAVTINVVSNDTDVDGDSLAVTEINGQPISIGNPVVTPNGTVALQPDGQLSFDPSANFNGPATFNYTVSDGNGGTDTALVTINVTAVNDNPSATNDTDSTTEDTAVSLNVLTNDSDTDGDALSVSEIDGQPISTGTPINVSNGSVELQINGELLFTPGTNYNGNASFDYTVSDGNGGSDTATVTITIAPVNDAPVATNDIDTLAEDTAITLDLVANDGDIDGDALVVTAINGSPITLGSPVDVTNGSVALQPDGTVIFTPTANYNGPANFTYTIADPSGASDTANVNLTITPVNDAPVAADESISTTEDTPVSLDVVSNDTDPEGDSLSVTEINGMPISVGNPVSVANGTVSVNASGSLTFSPAPDYVGPASFNYTVSDPGGATDSATVTVTVTAVNDAPVSVDDAISTAEETTVNIDVIDNDSDVDGDSLAVTQINGQPIVVGSPVSVPNGTVDLLSNGTLDFTPTANFTGAADFDYTVADPSGASSVSTVTVTVTAVNDAPVANDDSEVTPEDTAVTINVAGNDTDIDGDALSVTQVNGQPISVGNPVATSNGTVALQPDGQLVFTPNLNYNGPASFAYTIADPSGATDTATVNLTITASNDSPIATNDTDSTAEDIPVLLDVIGNDSDADGDSLGITRVNGSLIAVGNAVPVTNGVVTIDAAGALTFTPDANFNGPVNFDYTISDGNGLSDTATVNITVTTVNDGPVAIDDSTSTAEDTTVNMVLTSNDTDIDGDSLVVAEINGTPITIGNPATVANGTVTVLADGSVDVTPNANFTGDFIFDYTVSDGSGGFDTATVTVNVTPVNDAPTANDDVGTTPEDTPLLINVIGNDTDIEADALVVTVVDGQPISVGNPAVVANGMVALQPDGQLLFTPVPDFNGLATFSYTITDANGATDSATATITVSSVNDAPVAIDDNTSTAEDTAIIVDITGNDTDADGDALTPLSVNGAPIFAGSPVTVPNGIVSVDINGVVTFTPDANYAGPVTFDYTVIDTNGGTDSATVNITVTPVNDAPISVNDGVSTPEDTAVSIDVLTNDTDPDADPLTITAIDGNSVSVGTPITVANGSVELLIDGTLSFTPDQNFTGPTTFGYTVSDPGGLTSASVVTVSVAVQNDPPVAVSDSETTDEDTPVTINVTGNDTDIEGDSLSVSAINGTPISVGNPVNTPNGSVALQADGQLVFTPAPNYRGTENFSYTVIDGNGGSDTAPVTITVNAVNDDPVALNDADTTAEDTAISLNVLSNDTDIDGDTLSVNRVDGQVIAVGSPVSVSNGTVSLQLNGELLFTPDENFNGNTAFDYTVSDGNGASDTATVNLTVTPVNDSPVATNDSDTLAEDSVITLDLTANDIDPDLDALTITHVNGTPITTATAVAVANGTVSLQPDGTVSFTPEPHFHGNASFNYTVSDPDGQTDDALVNLTVTSVNDTPYAVIDTETTTEDTPVQIDVRANDGDVDGDSLTVTQINGSAISVGNPVSIANGTVSIDTNGQLTFSPAANYVGPATFDYTVSDGNGASATATTNISVTSVNDAPVASDDFDATTEDTAVSVNVVSNDTDIDGDALVVSAINGQPVTVGTPVSVTNGTVALQSNGELLFTPTTDYNGAASFDYTVVDNNGGSDTATVNITIDPVNDAPVATNDTDTLAEDTPITLDLVANDSDPEGDSLSITQINGTPITPGNPVAVGNGTVALQPNGTIVFTPAPDYTGAATFNYTVADPSGATDNATVNLTVSASNDAPQATNDAQSTAEDTPVVLNVRANDSDADGDPITVTQINGTAISVGNPVAVTNGLVSIDASGALTFAPDTNYTGLATFDYTISDGNGLSDTASVEITVTSVNDGPTAVNDNGTTNEDTLVNLQLTSNDSDPEGDPLIVSEINGTPITVGNPAVVANGTVTLLANGSLDVMPDANFTGDLVFAYTVSDGTGGSDTATVTIDVTPVNDAPTANNDVQNTPEDTPVVIDVVGNDTDIEADTLIVTRVDGQPISVGSPVSVTNGVVTLQANGQLLFTPASNYNGPVNFDYTISDGNGGTDTANALINITAVNDAPIAVNDNATTPEDTAVIIDLVGNDTDVEGNPLTTLSIDGAPLFAGSPVTVPNGVVSADINGVVTFTPDANYSGPVNFDYTVIDSNGATDTASVNITVTPVNDAPISIDDGVTTSEDTPVNIDALANDADPDSDALSITAIDGNPVTVGTPLAVTDGVVELLADGSLDFTPNTNFTGQATFSYTVADPGGLTSTSVVTVSVAVQNDAPVAVNDIESTVEDTPLTFDVRGNDTDIEGDALSVSAINGQVISVGNPVDVTNGSVALQPDGQLIFTPAPNYNGPASFDYTIIDGNGGSDTAQATVAVTPVNDNPVASNDADSTSEDTAVSLNVLTNDTDVDGDSLSISEVDGQPITLGNPINVANGTIELQANGNLLFTPQPNFSGNTTFDYTITDGTGSDTATVTLTVDAINDAPVATDDSDVFAEDTPVTLDLTANDTDIDGDALTITHVNGNPISTASSVIVNNGTVALQPDGTVIFTPEPHFVGATDFTYTVADPSGATDDALVDLTVTPVNDPPFALLDSATTPEDTALRIDVRANDGDVDGDPLTVTDVEGSLLSVGNPVLITNGTISIDAAGVLTFTPDANYTGPVSFEYGVSDGNGASASATATITVTPANDNPVAVDDSTSTPEDTTVNLDVINNDSDIDGDALSVSEINGTAITNGATISIPNGSVTLLADGSLDVTPAANYTGTLSFSYTTSDGAGGSDTASVDVVVTPENDAPIATDDSATTTEEVAVNLNLVANDTDIDSATLTVTQINGQPVVAGSIVSVTNGTATLLGNGTVDVTPDNDFVGPVSFDYTVSDGSGGTDTGAVVVTVTPTNDAPVAVNNATSTQEDTPVTLDVVANDVDVDGDSLNVNQINGQSISVGNPVVTPNGTVSLQPDGQLSFTPNLNVNGAVTFDYTISDGNGGTDSAQVTINISAVNDAPIAIDDSATTPEDTAVTINMLANDTDVDGDTLATIEIDGTPAFVGSPVTLPEGQVTVDINGVATFTPNPDFSGPVSFDYTVMDTSGATDTGTVNVTVTPVNDAPVAINDNTATNEDTAVNFEPRINDIDPDGDALSITEINGQPVAIGAPVTVTDGVVALEPDGTLSYTPSADFSGSTSFVYTVADPGGLSSSTVVNVLVAAQNDAPIATDDVDSTPEDTAVTINVIANDDDADNDALSVTDINGQPISVGNPVNVANGTVALLANGQLQVTPTTNFNGLVSFSYAVSDGSGSADTAQVDVNVTPVADTPVAVNDSATTPEDTLVAIDVVANDTDGDSDPLTVTEINGTPISTGSPVSVPNGQVSIDAAGVLIFSPAPDYSGPATFNYTVSDPAGNTANGSVDVTVTPVNDAPNAVNDTQSTLEETPVTIALLNNDSDPEGGALNITAVNGTAATIGSPITVVNGTVTVQPDQTVIFTPAPNYSGTASFNYTVSDPLGATETATVNLTIDNVNDQPIALNDSETTSEDTPVLVDVLANDTDVDGDTMTISAVDGNAITVGTPVAVTDGTVVLDNGGTLLFTPAAEFSGIASFTYTVTDPTGATDTATVDITVSAVNDAPIAVNDSASTDEDTPVLIDVAGNDTDVESDPLFVLEINGQPASVGTPVTVPNGSVALQPDGQILFTPDANFNGLGTFDYTVTDGNGATDTATVAVNVAPVPDAPIATDDNVSGAEDTPITINVIGNDQEVDGQIIAVNAVDGQPVTVGAPVTVTDGTVTLQPDGQLLFTPAANFNGTTSFDYTVVDTTGLTSTATANIDLAAVSDPPVANDDTENLVEDVSMTLDLTGNDVDIDGDPLVITQINGNPIVVGETVATTNGWVTLLSDGIVDFTPAPNYNGPASFAYTVGDGSGLTDSAMVNLNIASVPDAPDLVNDNASTPEETPVNIDPLNNDIDADANALAITQVNGTPITVASPVTVPGGSVSMLPDGTLDFTPDTDFNGTSIFSYTVSDGTGLTSTANIAVAVTPENDPPVAANESEVTTEDTTVNIDVLDNDTDPDDTALTVSTINGTPVLPGSPIPVANGSVTVMPDGTLDFEPAANYNGTTSFNYEVVDPLGAADTGQVTISVTAVDDAPIVSDDAISTDEETPVTVDPRINDSDVEGSPLTVSAINGAPVTPGSTIGVNDGTVTMQPDGTLSFTPASDFFGPTQFSYTVTDGNSSSTATVNVTVNGTDDPPTATNDLLTAQEDTPLLLDLLSNDVDPDGTALQITEIDGQPIAPRGSVAVVNGTVVMDPDGSVRFLPDPNVSGPTSFTYTVSDPTGLTSTAIAQLTITPVPDAPEPIDDVITIDEDGAAPLSLIANDTDPDGEPLTLTGIEGTPVEPGDTVIVDNGTVTVGDNGQVTFIPDPNFSGQANFSYTVADPTGASATAQVTVNVTPINDPPVAQPDTVTGLIGQPVTFDPTRNDNDVDADPLRISQIAGQPIAPGQTITIPEGTVTLQPDGRVVFNPFDPEQRQFELTYVVTDPSGLSSPATVSIVVQELGYPHEQEREDDVNRVEYDPLSLALPLARNGEYDPVFISPAVRISQQQTGNVDFSAFTSVHSTTNDVFAWNHSTNLDTRYGSHYINFAYVRSDDPMARDISDLICSQFDQNTNLVCWPQIRPESVANMQYILLDERIDKDTKKPDPNWRPAEIKPEAISRQSVSDLFPLSADKVSDKPAGFSDFTAQIESMTNKSFARDAKAVDADALEDLEPEPELENQ